MDAAGAVALGRTVIVGAGAAGSRFARGLRTGGFEGPVVLLGAEPDPPYHRPLLSKDVLKSTRQIEDILLNTVDELRDEGIDFRPSDRAVGIDRENKTVRLESGDDLEYDTLVLATGVHPRTFGSVTVGARVHTLYSAADCLRLRESLVSARTVAVIGSGFIGNEIAATSRELGLEVELISMTRYALQDALGDWVGARVSRMHEEHGVRMWMSSRVVSLTEDATEVRVELADGQSIAADVAVIGIGSQPTTEWLADAGLEVTDGVVVSEDGQTSDPSIWAIGDVALRRRADGTTSRVEHWTSATEQADGLARRLLARRASPVPPVNYVWTDLYGTKIQMLGEMPEGATEHVLLDTDDKFVLAYAVDGRVVGVVGQGIASRFMRFRMPIASGADVTELHALAG